MQIHQRIRLLLAAVMFVVMPTAHSALTLWTQGDLMIISGKAEAGDVTQLQAKLTPAIRFVVLHSPNGGTWTLAENLAAVVEKARVTTVVHGPCIRFVCPMLFLAGEQRMFSGNGRPESHYVALQFDRIGFVTGDDHTPYRMVHEWWLRHTHLRNADLETVSPLFFNKVSNHSDQLIFFPDAAEFSRGNVLHCADEMREANEPQYFSDCLPVEDASAHQRGIVTTVDTFSRPRILSVRPDVAPPSPSGIAALEDIPVAEISDECKRKYKIFLKQDSPRAFVVAEDGGCNWANAQTFRPHAFAMGLCLKHSKDCRYYTVDNSVVFTPFGIDAQKQARNEQTVQAPD